MCRLCLILVAALAAAATASGSTGPFAWFAPGPAPSSWTRAPLPSGEAVVFYPKLLHAIKADPGAVSAAQIDRTGHFLAYVNVTPHEGTESLANWVDYRLDHVRDEEIPSSVRKVAVRHHLQFRGGTGTCLIDEYTTVPKHHRYREIACFVKGTGAGEVIIAAAPPSEWKRVGPILQQAVSSFQVR
jgi:hypothetical protein